MSWMNCRKTVTNHNFHYLKKAIKESVGKLYTFKEDIAVLPSHFLPYYYIIS